jgi:CO dehydrogenase/acetyl-CoA synthase beta subunit
LEVFNDDIAWLRRYIESKRTQGRSVRLLDSGREDSRYPNFSEKESATIVLNEDTWLELGNPSTISTALALVTQRPELVNDGDITLIGPDIPDGPGSLAFAQILLIGSSELQDEDYRKVSSLQYEQELRGYMIKTVPSSLTLWSRVSKDSARDGFCFEVLGRAIIESYKSKFNNPSLEIVFVTSSKQDVEELEDLRRKVTRIVKAMNKMMEEMSFDCSSCEYLDVCGDVRQLGALREKLMKDRRAGDGGRAGALADGSTNGQP